MDSVPGIGNIGRKKDKSDSYCQGAYILVRADTGYIAGKSKNEIILREREKVQRVLCEEMLLTLRYKRKKELAGTNVGCRGF